MTCTFPHEYRSGHRQSNGMAHDHLYHYLAQFLASIHFPINSKQEYQVESVHFIENNFRLHQNERQIEKAGKNMQKNYTAGYK